MSRCLRSRLPSSPKLLVPSVVEQDSVQNHLAQGRLKQKRYYDRNARELKPLKEGEQCRVQLQPQGLWKPAIVTEHHTAPRSYIMKIEEVQNIAEIKNIFELHRKPLYQFQLIMILLKVLLTDQQDHQNLQNKNSLDSGKLYTRSGRLVKPNRKYTEVSKMTYSIFELLDLTF